MPASEARIAANRANSLKSTGPKTLEGKERSRRNGLKHGMAGAGVVLLEQDASEVERRNHDLQTELAPRSSLGQILVRQMAALSVRMERSQTQEESATELRVRHAAEDFDRARLDEADRLLGLLGEEPRAHLRKLRAMPEGVERLIESWLGLRADLTRSPRPAWTAWHLDRAANLTGMRIEDAGGTEIAALSKATWGDFAGLDGGAKKARRVEPLDDDGEDETTLDDLRRAEARALLVKRIDAEVADLEAHYETLDFATIDLDRAGAPDRALFDASKPATLARRYESEASRGFFKALKEFRRAEADAAERAELDATQEAERDCEPLASCRDSGVSPLRDPRPMPPMPRPGSETSQGGPVGGQEGRRSGGPLASS